MKTIIGKVEKIIDENTIKIVVVRKVMHKKYKKYLNSSKRFLVHSNSDKQFNIGDEVIARAVSKISKRKNFEIID